jgi:hypothetical protein
MQVLKERQAVVDLCTMDDVKGAVAVDLDANQVVVRRKKSDGGDEQITLYFPGGIRVVRRR